MFKRIVDHKYNELYNKKKQLTQELQILDKSEGKEQEKKDLKKQLTQVEKNYNDYLEKREKSYPECAYCSQKVRPSCLMVAGCPQNYHNECWIVSKRIKENNLTPLEERKERINNPLLFAKVERLEKELNQVKKTLSNR